MSWTSDSSSSKYQYKPCWNCGQNVAHTKGGEVLHSHANSRKCAMNGSSASLKKIWEDRDKRHEKWVKSLKLPATPAKSRG